MTASHRVVALVQPPQSTFELACAAEVFGVSRPGLESRYDFSICAQTPGSVPTLAGYAIQVGQDLSAADRADTLVIPGGGLPFQDQAEPDPGPAVVAAVRRAHARGARILAICSGAFVVAQAGLLDGRRAATHWRMAGELARRFPLVDVDPDVLYVDHGDVSTSAGTAAGIDLCLHILAVDHGAAYAAEVARHMVMPPRREGGQRQFASPPARRRDHSLAEVLDWAVSRLHTPITVADLANRAAMSPRTFARRFQREVGSSPGQWLLARRVEAARVLLEDTDLAVEAISARVGLSSAVNLRRHFHRHLGTTPGGYRRAFHTRAM